MAALSDHYVGRGVDLFQAAAERGLEGIVAKQRRSCYEQKRSREWLKIKITRRQECVIGGYTDPRGSRENFGSLVLGLYDDQERLIHVGHAGSGFTEQIARRDVAAAGEAEDRAQPVLRQGGEHAARHYVQPELVAEIKFTEWTHEGESGAVKMRAPVFEGLRFDKTPKECRFEIPANTENAVEQAEAGVVTSSSARPPPQASDIFSCPQRLLNL